MSKRFKLSALIATIAVAILALVFTTFRASAMSESELSARITKKVKYTNLFRCYDRIHNSAETLNFSSANDLFIGSDDNLIAPEGWSGVSGRCSDLVGEMIGSVPSDQSARGQVLQKLGYSGGGTSSRCVWFEYTKYSRTGTGGYSSQVIKTDKVCASVAADGTMSNYQTDTTAGEPYNITSFDGSQLVANYDDKINGGVYETYVQGYNNNWDAFVSAYAGVITTLSNQSSFTGVNGTTDIYYERSACDGPSGSCIENTAAGSGSYTISNRNTAASIAASNYLGLANGNFTTAEKVSLYQLYLKNNSSSIVCNPSDTPDLTVAHKVKLVIDSKYYENCYAIEREPGSTSVHAVDGNFSLTETINYQGIIDALNSMTATTDREGIIDPGASIGSEIGTPVTPDPTDGEPTEPTDATDVCYGSAGTLGMSWILCPILTWTSNGLNHIYGEIEQDYLRVDPSFVSTDNATYKAWQTFQNAANIILAILLLVVIFSQLTGIGIDNYGIKKILPRLIICAILINLSYFIAQFFVDISNIVGSSIRNLFEPINPDIINTSAEGVSMPSHILGITVLAAGAGWLVAAIANPAILLGLLLALISGLFAVLMMWLILIVRQAGVIIAVIIAPVAFVLYLLPNTSKFTKSWWNLMKSLLLLYPLAGLLIGASFFISNLMVGDSTAPNPQMVLPAMIMRVAPFFALPALFRKSVDAMGNLGTRIQGIGRNLSRATTNAARNADWYRNAQELGRERQLSRRAGYNLDGTKRTGIFAELRENADNSAVGRRLGWQRNRRKATEAYIKAQNERQKDDYLSNQDNISATLLGQESKWEKEQIENQSALLDKGMMTSVDGGNFQSYDNPESVKEELVKRLSQSPEEQEAHYAENMALWKKLQSFKDKGYDKTADLWDDRRITDSNSRMMQQIKADVAANGDFKNGARTAYDIITSSGGRKAGAVAAARGSGASLANLRMERIPDFSGDELKALSAVAQGQQYIDADGNTQTPTVETQAMASELLLNALSDSQVRRRFKGADADLARQGAVSAFKNNVDKYTDDKKDTEETYVNKNNPNQKFTFKRSQQGYLYDARTKNYIDEARVSRMFDRVY